MTFEEKINRIDEYLVGIWKFRQPNKKPLWCATFVYKGYYYDVPGNNDILVTLDEVHKKILRLKRNSKKK